MTITAPPRRPHTTPSSDPEALIPEARARQRQRRARLIIAAVILAALAGGIYGGFGGAANQPPTIPAIESNLASALAKAQTTLLVRYRRHRTKTPDAPAFQIELVDLANGQQRALDYDASGHLTTATSRFYSAPPTVGPMATRTVTVAYDSKTWSVSTGLMECGGSGQASHCTQPPLPTSACGCDLDPFTNFPGRALHVSLLGEQTIDGHPTFHLRFAVTGGPLGPSTTNFWIDQSTHLPVRSNVVYRAAPGNRQLGPTQSTTDDFTWLPRTSANLGQLTIAIPRGFKHTSASP